MKIQTAIYDMDGLLIDSEPLWHQAAKEILADLGVSLDAEAYATTVGLRTKEFLLHWFWLYNLDPELLAQTEENITKRVISLVSTEGKLMPGVESSIEIFRKLGFSIGLATSSPLSLVEAMLDRTGLHGAFDRMSSAADLPFGKPHPQVYLDCANALGTAPISCLCLEDSFNGMIAAKAARMTCIIVPENSVADQGRWHAADMKLSSLSELNEALISSLLKN